MLKQSTVTLALVLASAIYPLVAVAQGEATPADKNFAGKVMEAMSRRDKLRVGLFDYRIETKSHDDARIATVQTGTFAFDNDSRQTFHFFKINERKDDASSVAKAPDTRLGGAIVGPVTTVVFSPGAEFGFERNTVEGQSFAAIKPFEFRSFGFAFFGDYQRQSSFEEVLSGYLGWPDPKIIKETEQLVEYKSGGKVFTLDKDRDYWITSLNYITTQYEKEGTGWKEAKKQLVTGCEIQLQKLEGLWVPKDVRYSSTHGGSHHISIEWKSLNTVLPKDQFDPQVLKKLIGKEIFTPPTITE